MISSRRLALTLPWLALACAQPGSAPPAQAPAPYYGAPYGNPPGGYAPAPYQQPPPYGQAPYGQPPPYAQPAPYGQPPPYAQPQAQPPYATPAPTAPPPGALALPPAGSWDAGGSMTADFLRSEPSSVLAELVAALPDAARAQVQGIPLKVLEDPKEVNAFAGCSTGASSAFMGITVPLLLIAARGAEARAFDELNGTTRYADLAAGIAADVRAQRPVTGPPPGWLPSPQSLDPRKLARQRFLYDEQLAFVLGHELAHHWRGHTGCTVGPSAAAGPADLARALAGAVPLLNQPLESDADMSGTNNVLDAGARRASGAWTEEGAVMVLDFFSRLQTLGVESLLLGFLNSHPLPQLRLPIVQATASQWRAAGGRSGGSLPFPFPISLPGFGLPAR